VYVKHLSSIEFLTYAAFLGVAIVAILRFLPGRAPPVRTEPYDEDALGAHDRKIAKYFIAGAGFLVVGGLHMVAKNLPWAAEWLGRAGHAGHLVRDLSNTHLIIVGGGTLIATGLCWYALPRIVGRPLASEGLAQCAFWFTALGLAVFYMALVGNGIAIGRLVEHGWEYEAAKGHMGSWYRAPIGAGAGVMGVGYWCFAANVFLTVFQARLVKVPKPEGHLWRFFVTGAGALTVGTVQGVIQVQPANADWLHRAGHAGEWIDPISHAHINLVTGLTMLVVGALFYLAPGLGGKAPSPRLANQLFYALLTGSLAFYGSALLLGFHEGRLVVDGGLTPEQAEEATWIHPYAILVTGVAMFAAFWALLLVIVRCFRETSLQIRIFVLAGCVALGVGTLQGPVQAVPVVNELLDRGGQAGDLIVNLHAQLNMIGGLMLILSGLTLTVLTRLGASWRAGAARVTLVGVSAGMALYYTAGLGFAAFEAHAVASGRSFVSAIAASEPWQALVLVPAAALVTVGFAGFAAAVWPMTAGQRAAGRQALAATPTVYSGRIPRRVRRRSPAALAGYELPLGLLGFPGVGWLFAGFPLTASILLLGGPAFTWAVLPAAFSPFGGGPLRGIGWKVELVWLPVLALTSSALLFRAHARRRRRLVGKPPRPRGGYRTRVSVAAGVIGLVLVSLPFIAAVSGVGSSAVRYSYQPALTSEITGQFLATPRGPVKLFAWPGPRRRYPHDALRIHGADALAFRVRAAAVDDPYAYRLFDLESGRNVPLAVRSSSASELELAPRHRLASGRYAFVSTHEGMFGGRDFSFLTVVPPGAPVTAIGDGGMRKVPTVARSFPPVAAALVALLFVVLLTRSFLRRPGGSKALWAVGFALFAVATIAEALAQRIGWSPALFRSYYLSGGVLTVAYLGAGSAWLLLPRRGRDALLGALAVATAAAVVAVALAPVDAAVLDEAPATGPPVNDALGGNAFLWAVILNSIGTLFLVGGSLYSIVRRRRVRTNAWIACGALVVALATGMSRAGDYSLVYVGELVGIAMMFAGFRLVGEPVQPARQRVEAPLPRMAATP
jgi:hypothetical protein